VNNRFLRVWIPSFGVLYAIFSCSDSQANTSSEDISMHLYRCFATPLALFGTLLISCAASAVTPAVVTGAVANQANETIEPYQPRFGRTQPVVVVVGDNDGTELTDFVIPFGVLSASGVAQVVSVSTAPGTVKMFPALKVQAQYTLQHFDEMYPLGADYVIVPATSDKNSADLIKWLTAQSAKGSSLVSICNGALTLARTGLMDGHRATAHWASERSRAAEFPGVRWQKNLRYVADGKIISSAGISASLPVSIALVEAIAGTQKANELAAELGVTDWSATHNSDAFQQASDDPSMSWRVQRKAPAHLNIPLSEGMDEIALALRAEAYTHSGAVQVNTVSQNTYPVTTRHNLLVIPDKQIVIVGPQASALNLHSAAVPSAKALDVALQELADEYGSAAAAQAARVMEYPLFLP
jgi:transcriptional regulator GlxA family with amidase domain